MIIWKNIFLVVILFSSIILAQENTERIKVVGDSLVGKVINGESVREIYGNVLLTQANIVISCDNAIQYLARNDAILQGHVIAVQDSMTITTSEGFYYGNQRKTSSSSGIVMDDKKVILQAKQGEYFFDENKAIFQSQVSLFDSVTTLFSDKLVYFRDENRAVATGNVKIVDESNEISADSLEHFRNTQISIANSHVKIRSLQNNTIIFGNHLEDYPERKYTLINENPLLIQYDTTYISDAEWEIDTLIIKAEKMEAFRDSSNFFKATDSVKIIRDNFASVNDFALYLRNNDIIITKKISEDASEPILWYENSQLTGDSVTIYIQDDKIRQLDVTGKAFMLSRNKKYENRFDQTSSNDLHLYFENNKLKRAEFIGNVLSIYYLYEDEEANGLSKSSAKNVTVVFENNEVDEVRLYGIPSSEYYPEIDIIGNEKAFTLPRFIFYPGRPVKEELLKIN